MSAKTFVFTVVTLASASLAHAQSRVAPVTPEEDSPEWRAARDAETASAPSRSVAPITPLGQDSPPTATVPRSSARPSGLPSDQGQVWAEYDIRPYTMRVTTTNHPEQAIVDWILRETGYEAWHSDAVAVLSATPRTLRVYHTPEIQDAVADIVDRFVSSEAESQEFSLRVVTIGSPNWRARAQRMLKAVPVQTPGVNAWLLAKEDAATLLAELSRRTDYREHSSPYLVVHNGQSTVVSVTRPRKYIRDIIPRPNVWPGFESQMGQIDEGFTLQLNPLLSSDGSTIDAAVKCHIDQIEKMVPITLEVPTPIAPRQRARVEVPQLSQCRVSERFRWPADEVLLVGLGVVPTPVTAPSNSNILDAFVPTPPRADLLVFVEGKGSRKPPVATQGLNQAARPSYHGRY